VYPVDQLDRHGGFIAEGEKTIVDSYPLSIENFRPDAGDNFFIRCTSQGEALCQFGAVLVQCTVKTLSPDGLLCWRQLGKGFRNSRHFILKAGIWLPAACENSSSI
jgi:hypothetical protein